MRCLILVDLQNDFLPGGALAVPDGHAVLPVVNRIQPSFPLVVATQDWHPANHGSFAVHHPGTKVFELIELNGLPQTLWPVHCVEGTQGAELSAALDQSRIARVFRKGTDPAIDSYSGLFDNGHRRSTGLGEWLREQGVDEVFICGLATDYCVKFTALDAAHMGFKTHLIEDACRGVNLGPDDVNQALKTMAEAGVIVTSVARLQDLGVEASRIPTTEASPGADEGAGRGGANASDSRTHPLQDPRTSLRRQLYAGQFLGLFQEGHWEYAARVRVTGAAMIVAMTPENRVLLVEQYRIPVHARTIELPAGIVGDEPDQGDEAHAEAARRELLEETGYAAQSVELLTEGPSSSGLASEIVSTFLATGLRREHAGGGVAHEAITVHEIPVREVHAWLEGKARAGVLVDPKVYAGLYWLQQRGLKGM